MRSREPPDREPPDRFDPVDVPFLAVRDADVADFPADDDFALRDRPEPESLPLDRVLCERDSLLFERDWFPLCERDLVPCERDWLPPRERERPLCERDWLPWERDWLPCEPELALGERDCAPSS